MRQAQERLFVMNFLSPKSFCDARGYKCKENQGTEPVASSGKSARSLPRHNEYSQPAQVLLLQQRVFNVTCTGNGLSTFPGFLLCNSLNWRTFLLTLPNMYFSQLWLLATRDISLPSPIPILLQICWQSEP